MKKEEIQAWREYIGSGAWTWFGTFTTSYASSKSSMSGLMDRFGKALRTHTTATGLYFIEPNVRRGEGYHAHAVIEVPEYFRSPGNYKAVIDLYQKMAGADKGKHMVKLEAYNQSRKAAEYLTKTMWVNAPEYGVI